MKLPSDIGHLETMIELTYSMMSFLYKPEDIKACKKELTKLRSYQTRMISIKMEEYGMNGYNIS